MIRLPLPIVLLPVALIMAACAPPSAPIVPRTSIEADVRDARCRAVGTKTRHDAAPVPYSVETLALGLPVTVTCERNGYQPSSEPLYPLPKPPLARALVNGARLSPMAETVPPPLVPPDNPVPAGIMVPMRPLLFTSPGARDRYFDRLKRQRQERWQVLADRLQTECLAVPAAPGGPAAADPKICRAARDALAEQRADDLRRLEIERRRATFQ